MASSARDDWDRHWLDYNEAAEENPAQRFRQRIVERLLAIGGRARILDIGSGQGDLAVRLADRYRGAEIVGLEYSHTGVAISQKKVPGATFIQRDLSLPGDPPPELAGWATHAVCSEVLEHVDEPGLLLRNALAYCGTGCRLVVTVPGGPMSVFDRHIGHRRHYTPRELAALLTSSGLAVETVHTVGFPMFNIYRLVVIARGKQLARDLASSDGRTMSPAARAAMRLFRMLLAVDLRVHRFGWQVVAVARVQKGS